MDCCYLSPKTLHTAMRYEACVIALGFFDGVHLAHQRLLQEAKRAAEIRHLPLAVITFSPHPKALLAPEEFAGGYITPFWIKKAVLEQNGVNRMYVIPFDKPFSSLSPDAFVNQYLLPLNPKAVVAGYDFRYGKSGAGDVASLAERMRGIAEVIRFDKMMEGSDKISSTMIRKLILSGQVEMVKAYLGRDYALEGKLDVSFSKGRRRFAVLESYVIPCAGLYHVQVFDETSSFSASCVIDENQNLQFRNQGLPIADGRQVTVRFLRKITGTLMNRAASSE